MASIKFAAVGKRYPNGFVALENLNLEIADKEFLVLLGLRAAASPPPST